jgi:hypothetical protein
MLARAVQSYLAVRRAAGYALKKVELSLRSFAADSDRKGRRYVTAKAAIEWGASVAFTQSTRSPIGSC